MQLVWLKMENFMLDVKGIVLTAIWSHLIWELSQGQDKKIKLCCCVVCLKYRLLSCKKLFLTFFHTSLLMLKSRQCWANIVKIRIPANLKSAFYCVMTRTQFEKQILFVNWNKNMFLYQIFVYWFSFQTVGGFKMCTTVAQIWAKLFWQHMYYVLMWEVILKGTIS